MDRRLVLLAVFLVVLAAIGLGWHFSPNQVGLSPPPARVATQPAAPAPPRPRTALPRPRSEPVVAAEQRSLPPSPEPEAAGPAPRRSEVALPEPEPSSAAAFPQAIKDAVRDDVVDPVRACLEQTAPPAGFDGKMLLDLHFDADGLDDAAIDDLTGLPDGLVDCVADVVWSADWPRPADGEIDVTYPLVVSVDR